MKTQAKITGLWQRHPVPCPRCNGQNMKTLIADMCAACKTAERKAIQARALGPRR
jgi:hypothetical protein